MPSFFRRHSSKHHESDKLKEAQSLTRDNAKSRSANTSVHEFTGTQDASNNQDQDRPAPALSNKSKSVGVMETDQGAKDVSDAANAANRDNVAVETAKNAVSNAASNVKAEVKTAAHAVCRETEKVAQDNDESKVPVINPDDDEEGGVVVTELNPSTQKTTHDTNNADGVTDNTKVEKEKQSKSKMGSLKGKLASSATTVTKGVSKTATGVQKTAAGGLNKVKTTGTAMTKEVSFGESVEKLVVAEDGSKELSKGVLKPESDESKEKPTVATEEPAEPSFYDDLKAKLGENKYEKIMFPVERENEITVDVKMLQTSLSKSLTEAKGEEMAKDFSVFNRALQTYYHVQLHNLSQNLSDSFAPFDSKTGEARIKAENIADFELDEKEDEFLDLLYGSLQKANFKLLSQREYLASMDQTYLVNLEIDVDKEKLDNAFVTRFNKRHPASSRADVTDDFLVFHRGTGVDTVSDMFIFEKVEIILDRIKKIGRLAIAKYLPVDMQKKAEARANEKKELKPVVFRIPKDGKEKGVLVAISLAYFGALIATLSYPPANYGYMTIIMAILTNVAIVGGIVYTFLYNPESVEAFQEKQKAITKKKIDVAEEANEHTKYIERLRLENIPLLPHDLLVEHTVQEPTYADMVLVYRDAGHRSINVKRFRDVPRADMELIFPAKTVRMNSTDTLIFLGTVIGGLVALISSSVGDDFENIMYTAAFGVIVLIIRAALLQNSQQYYYDAILTKTLYERQSSNDDCTLVQLIKDCEQQEVKEAMLGYYMLLYGGPMKEDILDFRIESLLRESFDQNVDFEVSDSIEKLVDLDIVTKSGSGLYSAKPLREAISLINAKWAEMDIGVKKEVSASIPGTKMVKSFFSFK